MEVDRPRFGWDEGGPSLVRVGWRWTHPGSVVMEVDPARFGWDGGRPSHVSIGQSTVGGYRSGFWGFGALFMCSGQSEFWGFRHCSECVLRVYLGRF